jgi:hypothetical protein
MNRYRATIRLIAGGSFLLLILAAVFSNFDGILGLGIKASEIIIISLWATAWLSWVLVVVYDRGARILAILMLMWLFFLSLLTLL